MAIIDVRILTKAVAALVKTLSPRNRDIVSRRFGLKSGNKETLEAIGKGYGITRERVRQIEEFSLSQLAKSVAEHRELARLIGVIREHIAKDGGVVRERQLFKTVTGSDKDNVANASLVFALTLDRQLVRSSDSDRFHAFWATDARQLDSFNRSVGSLIGLFAQASGAQGAPDTVRAAAGAGLEGFDGAAFAERHLQTVLAVCKDVGTNIYGQVGLSAWAEIRPKGVRDKAYLVMKKAAKPQHFTNIAKLINAAKFDAKKVNVQTVHNELIKDKRFVLVGRGLYALAEWGYKSGTVKDVLVDILKGHTRSLTRADLIAKVGEVRLVKENTILLNLQDSSTFVRDANGHYSLRRK
ncbi:MAG TPA: sigma factor-like helix-turn-helix DNA-binding protein [Candidatus Paceibacterota bacterium]|nr:sigma factor-like helix-turn-helix DNA-binding protein [Candidatus Paceibacterota bacterium]